MSAAADIVLIAAVAENGVIGADGRIPWRLSTDMRRFKALTMGKPVIMGRRTWDSLGRPLPGRTNIVVTRQAGWSAEGTEVAASVDEALALANKTAASDGVGEIMVIGGAEIYEQTIGRAACLYITHVAARLAGDAHFPAIKAAQWEAVSEEEIPAGERDSLATRFVVYRRRGG